MSKTVKRIMTAMLIGLVAMLDAKVEAHWIVLKGHCYWHSGECVRKDTDPGPINLPPLGELVAEPTTVELLCPGGIETINPSGIILATPRTPIEQGAITQRRDPNGQILSKNLEWQRAVSDAFFYIPSTITSCSGGLVSPTEVLVRTWSNVRLNLYSNNGQQPHSAWQAEICTLPDQFNLSDYPKNLPPRGALYDCGGGKIGEQSCHRVGPDFQCNNL